MHIYVFYFATTTIARVFSRVVVVIRVIQHRHRRRNVNIDNTGSIISTVPNIIIHRRMRVRMQRRIITPLHSPKESHYSFLFSLFREHICCCCCYYCHSFAEFKNGGSFLSRVETPQILPLSSFFVSSPSSSSFSSS